MDSGLGTVKDIIGLYRKVPEYCEVKHLRNSEFIHKIEKLKEEFRGIRSSLFADCEDGNGLSQSGRDALNKEIKESKVGNVKRRNIKHGGNSASTSYLSVKSCQIHHTPLNYAQNIPKYFRPSTAATLPTSSSFSYSQPHLKYFQNQSTFSSGSFSSSSISHSSSTPEISNITKEYFPPQNVQNRLLLRKAQEKVREEKNEIIEDDGGILRAEIPTAVTKPLFDKIVNQKNKRSQEIREQRKQNLLAQVKPFSFCNRKPHNAGNELILHPSDDKREEILNNSKSTRSNKTLKSNLKIYNNTLDSGEHAFKAHPAPPRSRALMAALRLKEQQEYRELKKQLRSQALMKMSSLPPGMAARDRNRYKSPQIQSPAPGKAPHFKRNRRNSECDSSCTDEDRVSEASFLSKEVSKTGKPRRSPHSSYASGLSNTKRRAIGVFESTSNDNNASRLRVAAAKKKEEERIRQEKLEQLKLMKEDEKRYKLRSYHCDVWRRACSYSSNHDIAMRRELRIAAAILESDSFRKDMSSMLMRVRSAPLLLEGIRERNFQPCRKHHHEQETQKSKYGDHHSTSYSRKFPLNSRRENVGYDEQSETLALAEGNISSSDNESENEIDREEREIVEEIDPKNDAIIPAQIEIQNSKLESEQEEAEIEGEADAIIGNVNECEQ